MLGKRIVALLAAASASIVFGTLTGCTVDADAETRLDEPRERKTVAQPATALGISSCAASSCHGGVVGENGPDWHSSYTSWFSQDPHGKAYTDLFNDRSRRMIERLEQGMENAISQAASANTADQKSHGYLAALDRHGCLACHANAASTPSGELSVRGLDCHNCHGADRGWVAEHYLAKWDRVPEPARRSLGMQPTKDLAGRAGVCVQCHVGAPANEGSPRRDVNHDLIAVGHPRLNFEFAAYAANLPKHWDEAKDRARLAQGYDNVEAHAWLTGQEVSATAALHLLLGRAERAAKGDASHAVWPEFAEYDCYGCHHQLTSPTTRPASEQAPGQWQWGTWHFGLMRHTNPTLTDLLTGMQRIAPPEAIIELVTEPRTSGGVRLELPRPGQAGSLTQLTNRLSSIQTDDWHWDQYAQWYLGLRALQAACREENARQQSAASPQQSELAEALDQLEQTLKFPANMDSPWSFDSTDPELRQLVERIRRLVALLSQTAANEPITEQYAR